MITKTYKKIIPVGGYIPDKPDARRYSYGAVFGVAEYPRKFTRELPDLNIPYQGQIPSCVACSFTFLNQYKSLVNDNNNLNLSWRRPFSQTGPYNIGRNLEDMAKHLKDQGQPQDQFCEDDVNLPEAKFMRPIMTIEGLQDALKRVIGAHWWVRPDNLAEICSAVVKEPIMITLGGINSDWTKPYGEIITKSTWPEWYHALVLWDYDLDAGYFRIINWWGDGVRKLSINYPLTSALSFADIPDTNMFKVLKTADSKDQWLINGNSKFRIPDADTFHFYKGKLGIINDPATVAQSELDQYITDEMLPSVLLTRTLAPVAKDIYQLE